MQCLLYREAEFRAGTVNYGKAFTRTCITACPSVKLVIDLLSYGSQEGSLTVLIFARAFCISLLIFCFLLVIFAFDFQAFAFDFHF